MTRYEVSADRGPCRVSITSSRTAGLLSSEEAVEGDCGREVSVDGGPCRVSTTRSSEVVIRTPSVEAVRGKPLRYFW